MGFIANDSRVTATPNRDYGNRFVVHAHEKQTAFLEPEIHGFFVALSGCDADTKPLVVSLI